MMQVGPGCNARGSRQGGHGLRSTAIGKVASAQPRVERQKDANSPWHLDQFQHRPWQRLKLLLIAPNNPVIFPTLPRESGPMPLAFRFPRAGIYRIED